jgi:hemerythrin-like domain-containing protein
MGKGKRSIMIEKLVFKTMRKTSQFNHCNQLHINLIFSCLRLNLKLLAIAKNKISSHYRYTRNFLLFLLLSSSYFFGDNQIYSAETLNEEVSPVEDLMREHGILNRLLLIYQEFARRIDNQEPFDPQILARAATIVRNFLENYHEKLEETFLFPFFEKSNKEIELVKTLKEQHNLGRKITDFLLSHLKEESLNDDIQKMVIGDYLKLYIRMFRPHAEREVTVLFPKFKELLSKNEYNHLGEIFEKKEQELFGKDGFEDNVKKVSEIEKKLGIYNLSKFSPKLSP